jgi:hypothetical protein
MKNNSLKVKAVKTSKNEVPVKRNFAEQVDLSIPVFYASDHDVREAFEDMTRYSNNDFSQSDYR